MRRFEGGLHLVDLFSPEQIDYGSFLLTSEQCLARIKKWGDEQGGDGEKQLAE